MGPNVSLHLLFLKKDFAPDPNSAYLSLYKLSGALAVWVFWYRLNTAVAQTEATKVKNPQ